MPQLTPFAEMPASPEGLIAHLRQQLAERFPEAAQGEPHALDVVAEQAVHQLWPSRVKTFVPLLALRDAQDMLREQGMTPWPPAASSALDDAAAPRPTPRRVRAQDRMSLARDTMSLDESDSLEL